jgi:hypothetical protein
MNTTIIPNFNARLLAVLIKHDKLVRKSFAHTPKYVAKHVTTFLKGDEKSYIPQSLSAIGANLVDRGEADTETKQVYAAAWKLSSSQDCPYCEKPVKYLLLMSFPGSCSKARCQLAHMRASL